MKRSFRAILLLAFIFGAPGILMSKCIPRPTYIASVLVFSCDDLGEGSAYLTGALQDITQDQSDHVPDQFLKLTPYPKIGTTYTFLLLEQQDKGKTTVCERHPVNTKFKGSFSSPCFDTGEPERRFDFHLAPVEIKVAGRGGKD